MLEDNAGFILSKDLLEIGRINPMVHKWDLLRSDIEDSDKA